MRKGYTFIELLIVISVLGIISIFAINSYNQSEEDLGFHTELSAINGMINNARAAALSESTSGEESDVLHMVVISAPEQRVYRYVEQGGENEHAYDEGVDGEILEELSLDLGTNDVLDYSRTRVLFTNGDWSSLSVSRVLQSYDIAVAFSPPLGTCDLVYNGQIPKSAVMSQLGFSKSGSDNPTRFIYIHNKSCLSELLIEDLAT